MAHVVRIWRTSRIIRFFVLVVLFGTATQLLLSRESPQTKVIGSERLVSIDPLPTQAAKYVNRFPPLTRRTEKQF